MPSNLRDKAYEQGRKAVAENDGTVPYRSGQRLLGYFHDGVVDAVECEADIPDAYLKEDATFQMKLMVGRCFHKLKIWPEDRGYTATSPVFSGWLSQKDVVESQKRFNNG